MLDLRPVECIEDFTMDPVHHRILSSIVTGDPLLKLAEHVVRSSSEAYLYVAPRAALDRLPGTHRLLG